MKWVIAGIVNALLVAGTSAQTISNSAAFDAAINAIREAENSTDKFAEPVKLPLEGSVFRLTLIPEGSAVEGSGGFLYDYVDGTLTFDLSPTTVWPIRTGPKDKLLALKINSTTVNHGTSLKQNAYGAVAEVRTFRNKGAAVAILDSPMPMISPQRQAIGAKNLEDTDWWFRVDLPPAQAKALAADVIAIVEGTYASLPNGKAGACHFGAISATIDSPTSYSSEVCYVAGNIHRISFSRKSTGEVLKEWSLENSPRLGPVLWDKVRLGMAPHDLKAVYPDYERGKSDGIRGASLNMRKGVVSGVEIQADGPERGKALVKVLTAQYGPPLRLDCIAATLCEGEWAVDRDVVVYLSITGRLAFQQVGAEPPVGYTRR